jgi:cell division protein FtsB
MNPEPNAENIGQTLGFEGVGSVVGKVEEYCSYEEKRIVLKNEPRILCLQAEIAILSDEERALEERLRQAQPPCESRSRRKAAYYWTVTILLALAAFVFSLLAFDPYRLGWKSYLYCVGIAIVTPFLVDEAIERWNMAGLVKTLATVAGIAALLSLIFLAVIRGDLLAHEVDHRNQTVVSDDIGSDAQQEPQSNFYRDTLLLLRLAMALLAVAMELGAGIALHRAWRLSGTSGEDWTSLRCELKTVRKQIVALATEIATLENEPAIFVAQFWRNFYHAMLTHTVRNAMAKLLLGFVFVVLPVFQGRATAEERVTVIAALDLTQSVALAGPDKQTDFQKNVQGITRLLAQAPVSARIIVLGITDKSFAHPYILLSARVPDDPGYFGERLQTARRQLIIMWKRRAAALQPQFSCTDIIGSLLVASQIFDQSPSQSWKELVIFSDMRHHTPDLDLESRRSVPNFADLERQSKAIPLARLRGVDVHVLGVDGIGKPLSYWEGLKLLWSEYFERAGAMIRSYSVLRDLPGFAEMDGR